MDPRIRQVLAQQRRLSRQADILEWGGHSSDTADDQEFIQSQMIRETVEELDDPFISSTIKEMYQTEEFVDLLDFIKGTFRGTTQGNLSDVVKHQLRRRTLFLEMFKLLQSSHLKQNKSHSTFCTQVVEILRREIDTLDLSSLPTLIEYIIFAIEQTYRNQEENEQITSVPIPIVELLPHLFGRMLHFNRSIISSEVPSTWDFSDGENWTGAIYVDRALDRLIKARWPQKLVCQLVDVFRDVELTVDQHSKLCKKFLTQIDIEMTPIDVETQPDYAILPGLLYHLQLFVQVGSKALKLQVLNCWVHHMLELTIEATRLDSPSRSFMIKPVFGAKELRAFQATLLYQLDKLVVQNDSLGNLILDLLEPQEWASTHIAMLLLLRLHNKFESSIDKLCLDTFGRYDTDAILTLVLEVIASSGHGQLESLVSSAIAVGFNCLASSSRDLIELGIQIIRHTFHQHPFTRASVIESVMAALMSSSHELHRQNNQNSSGFAHVKLFSTLIESCLLDFDAVLLNRVRDLIDYLPSFSVSVAIPLLTALTLVLRQKVHLRNALILTMRKAMFKREPSPRIIAICGFCTVLECAMHANNAKPIYLTQRYASVHAASQVIMSQSQSIIDMDSQDVEQGNVTSVFRQFSSLFRRALGCQRVVRHALYVQLKRIVKQCPELRPSVIELLWPHMQTLVEPNEALSPPVYLKQDDSVPILLDTLLACKATEVESIMERLKHIEMEDFELDKTSVLTPSSLSRHTAQDVVLLCDVSLNYIWEQSTENELLSQSQRAQSIKIIETRHRVELLMKAGQPPMKGKRKREKASKGDEDSCSSNQVAPTQEDLPCLVIHHRSLLIALATIEKQVDGNLNTSQTLECILSYTQQLMEYWRGQQDEAWLQQKSRLILRLSVRMQREFLSQLAGFLWKLSETILPGNTVDEPTPPTNNKKKKPTETGKSLQSIAYQILHLIFDASKGNTTKLLSSMLEKEGSNESLALDFQKKVFAHIRNQHPMEAHLLLSILVSHIFPTFSNETTERTQKWMEAVCTSQSIVYLPLIELFMKTLLLSPIYMLRVSNGIKKHLAHEEEDEGNEAHFSCISVKTITPIMTLLLEALEGRMNQIEIEFKNRIATNNRAVVDGLYDGMVSISQCCSSLLSNSFPNQTMTRRVLRTVLRYYKVSIILLQRKIRYKIITISNSLRNYFDAISRQLIPLVLQFIACTQEENKRIENNKFNDSKLIPELIYQIEQFDVQILKLSKLCKNINFTRWRERRQARDFKINQNQIIEILPNDIVNNDDTEDEDIPLTGEIIIEK